MNHRPHDLQGASSEDEYRTNFFTRLYDDIVTWPREKLFLLDDIHFDEVLNEKCGQSKKTEMAGINVVYELAKEAGGVLHLPGLYNETANAVLEMNGLSANISFKTATIHNDDAKQRYIRFYAQNNVHFCKWVVASYKNEGHMKVAVIPAEEVYSNVSKRAKQKSLSWNEKKLEEKGIQLFDFRTAAEKSAFLKYVTQDCFTPPVPKKEIKLTRGKAKTPRA